MRKTQPTGGATEEHGQAESICYEEGLISIVILSYNKKDFLERCLAAALKLSWSKIEVIVVDNASSDGSPEMVEQLFGKRVQLIRRGVNSPTAGRNSGFKAARGEFVLSLDNDIVLHDTSVLDHGASLFRQFPKVGVLAFKICTIESPDEPLPEHWWYAPAREISKNQFFFTDYFSEGAVLFRSDALRHSGGYDDSLFQGFEGVELSLRLIRDGYEILYCPVLSCIELRVRGFLSSKRTHINYLSLRNRLWIVWKHYPFWKGLAYAVGRVGIAMARSIRYGWIDYCLRGIIDGIRAPQAIRMQRKPLSRDVWGRIRDIRTRGYATGLPEAMVSAPSPDASSRHLRE